MNWIRLVQTTLLHIKCVVKVKRNMDRCSRPAGENLHKTSVGFLGALFFGLGRQSSGILDCFHTDLRGDLHVATEMWSLDPLNPTTFSSGRATIRKQRAGMEQVYSKEHTFSTALRSSSFLHLWFVWTFCFSSLAQPGDIFF